MFSLVHIFLYMSLDSVHMLKNMAQRKPLYLQILCSVQLSLLVNLGTNLQYTSSVSFHAATNNSVHIW